MKVIKLGSIESLLTVDSEEITVDNTVTVDSTQEFTVQPYIDFVPRILSNDTEVIIPLTVDSGLVTVDDTITVDMTDTSISNVRTLITNEFTNQTYNVPVTIIHLNGSIYRLYFQSTTFIKDNSKYSIEIKDNDELMYKGKMMTTSIEDIQNYRYTTIMDNKMYL